MPLGEFIENDHLRRYLGERFCHVYHACKNDELLQFERLITETEIEWMLKKRVIPLAGLFHRPERSPGPDICW